MPSVPAILLSMVLLQDAQSTGSPRPAMPYDEFFALTDRDDRSSCLQRDHGREQGYTGPHPSGALAHPKQRTVLCRTGCDGTCCEAARVCKCWNSRTGFGRAQRVNAGDLAASFRELRGGRSSR